MTTPNNNNTTSRKKLKHSGNSLCFFELQG